MILVHEHRRFKGDSSVMDTQPRSYGLYEFDIAEDDSSTSPTRISGRFPNNGHPAAYQFTAIGHQRSAYFFPLTREQPLHQCECAVEFRYNITLGILHFYPSRSYGLYEFDIAEDDSSTSPTRISGRFPNNGHPAAYQITAIGQQRSAYFFPLTREQPLHQCECAVEFRYNITLGILHFYPSRSYGLYEFDIAEDDSYASSTRISGRFLYNGHPAAYQITAIGQQVTSC
ncbi:Ubiquitin carboxyl-terminal hydrolase [Trichinella spiralis]|uniref:Ubiquitin carboxyl-terminal hydrolase n=1 Tax=Trichinella spiralis TaxID=6334 RepID=A0ABR3KDK8_TRISP